MLFKKLALIAFILSLVPQAHAESSAPPRHKKTGIGSKSRYNSVRDDFATYQVGSTWGKHSPTNEELENPVFKRAALATAKVTSATGFYLGKFNGVHVVATNHHVCPNGLSCLNTKVRFPLLTESQFRVSRFLGHWSEIDLALITIEVESREDEAKLSKVARNFTFNRDVFAGQPLLTIGFGIANNRNQSIVANQDEDCKVFSKEGDYKLMADPDDLNPADYKAWSFSNGCDISHGDSGSAMIDRRTGDIIGIIWTGRIPKSKEVQNSANLDRILSTQSKEVWTELSYAVPAAKMAPVLAAYVKNERGSDRVKPEVLDTIEAILRNTHRR